MSSIPESGESQPAKSPPRSGTQSSNRRRAEKATTRQATAVASAPSTTTATAANTTTDANIGINSNRIEKGSASRGNKSGAKATAAATAPSSDVRILSNSNAPHRKEKPQSNTITTTAAASATTAGAITPARSNELYGVVAALKTGGYGFIQPLLDDEQLYFTVRDALRDAKVGERVAYLRKVGPKGLVAEAVRIINTTPTQPAEVVSRIKLRGVVKRAADKHRSGFGLVAIDTTASATAATATPTAAAEVGEEIAALRKIGCSLENLPFRAADVVSKGGKGKGGAAKIDSGDVVEFDLLRLPQSSFFFASSISRLQNKKDREVALQAQKLLDGGAVREHGIITTLKKGEYGFIRSVDRVDEVYFRADDVLLLNDAVEEQKSTGGSSSGNQNTSTEDKLAEGAEVDFLVTRESIKGKMCDRAVHVKLLPAGTVKFEVLVASGVTAAVIAESGDSPEESPGLARLSQPAAVGAITGVAGDSIDTIDLWQRCLPDGLHCKVGDTLKLDVHYYRPEKLYFARSVKLLKFRSIGRENGVICALKDHGSKSAYGFIHSTQRNLDIYFKSMQVFRWDGVLIPETSLKNNAKVTFDVSADTSASTIATATAATAVGRKLRATRVMLVSPSEATDATKSEAAKCVLKRGVRGVVVRITTKKDSPGLIRIHEDELKEVQCIKFYDPELVEALNEFVAVPELKIVALPGLPVAVLKNYYNVIEGCFPLIAHHTELTDAADPNAGKTIIIVKMEPDEYKQWITTNAKANHSLVTDTFDQEEQEEAISSSSSSSCTGATEDDSAEKRLEQLLAKGSSDPSAAAIKLSVKQGNKEFANGTIQFFKEDYISTDLGPISSDLQVVFDVCWNKSRCKKIAKNVRLTDELITAEPQFGIIDVLVEKSDKFGFIRCIPSDEKLFWHMSAAAAAALTAATTAAATDKSSAATVAAVGLSQQLATGSEVSFELRRRGGLRCAANVTPLAEKSLHAAVELPETCSALVVDTQHVVLLDATCCPLLRHKYIDLRVVIEFTSLRIKDGNAKVWEKGTLSAADAVKTPIKSLAERLAAINLSVPVQQQQTEQHGEEYCKRVEELKKEVQREEFESRSNEFGRGVNIADTVVNSATFTGTEDIVAAVTTSSTAAAVKDSFQLEYKPKYCSPLARTPIPLSTNDSTAAAVAPVVGSVVQCYFTVNWAQQRSPIAARIATTAATTAVTATAVKRTGRINRMKFRVPVPTSSGFVDADTLAGYNISTIDFVEIYCDPNHSNSSNNNNNNSSSSSDVKMKAILSVDSASCSEQLHGKYFYCDARELFVPTAAAAAGDGSSTAAAALVVGSNSDSSAGNLFSGSNNNNSSSSSGQEYSRSIVQYGDEVEFWTVPDFSGEVAFHVKVTPKLNAGSSNSNHIEMSFGKRPLFNSALKEKAAASVILMAEGPPNDASHGFPDGWRQTRDATATAEGFTGLERNDSYSSGSGSSVMRVDDLPWQHLLPHLPRSAAAVVTDAVVVADSTAQS